MSAPTPLNPTVSVSQTTAYVLRAKAADYGANLIDNSDFEQGNSGFWSDYNYNPNFSGYPWGSYDVTTAPGPPYTACPGHGGTGCRLLSTGPNSPIG